MSFFSLREASQYDFSAEGGGGASAGLTPVARAGLTPVARAETASSPRFGRQIPILDSWHNLGLSVEHCTMLKQTCFVLLIWNTGASDIENIIRPGTSVDRVLGSGPLLRKPCGGNAYVKA